MATKLQSKPKALNINELFNSTSTLQLIGPDGKTDLPVKLTIQSINNVSIRDKAAEASFIFAQVAKSDNPQEQTKQVNKANSLLTVAAAEAIVGWDNNDFMAGAYTPQYIMELLARPEMQFIQSQVISYISKQSHFFR